MSELPGYSPYGAPPPEPASSTTSLATSLAASSLALPTPSIRSTTPPVFPSLPHFPDDQPRESLAGPVKTTSLSDMQHDYFRVTRVTNTTYSVALTTDPTPLYRVEVDPHIAADPAIQVFDLFNPLPLATARLHPAVATSQSCTRDPAGDNPKWRPMSLLHFSSIPLVVIPGMAPIERSVRWQHTTKQSTNLELWMRDPLFGISAGPPQSTMPREMLLARYGIEGVGFVADRVLEIRRGGGMEFELVVLVQAFAILEADRRKKARKGGK